MDVFFLQIMPDGGPVYKEFYEHAFIKEPWNAYSSLLFFVPVIYWGIKLRKDFKERSFLYVLLLFLTLNGLGSTLYHAFRAYPLFMYLDFLPAIFFTAFLAFFFWNKVLNSWWKAVLILFLMNSLRFIFVTLALKQQALINLNYFITGVSIVLPAFIVLYRTKFRYAGAFFLSVLFLSASLVFRVIDKWNTFELQMGTHFLWHFFSVLSVFPLFHYLYFIQFHPLKGLWSQNKSLNINREGMHVASNND